MIFKYLKPFRFFILLTLTLLFVQVVTDLLLPAFMARIVNQGIALHDTSVIFRYGLRMLGVALGGIACSVIGGFFASRTATGFGRELRSGLFTHISHFALEEFNRLGTSSLITRTTNDVQQVQFTVFMAQRVMMRSPLIFVGAIVMAVHTDRHLSLMLLAFLPIVVFLVFFISKRSLPLFRSMQKKIDALNLVLREHLSGIRIIRAFSRVGYEKRRFAAANRQLMEHALRANRLLALLGPGTMLIMNVLIIVIIWASSSRIDAGTLQIGDMMAFIQYAMQIFMSLMMMTMIFVLLPRAMASSERINAVFAQQPTVSDPDHPVTPTQITGNLTFDDVTFRYQQAENPSLQHISFRACPGETIAVIGGTGAGKSALLDLILRYYDVERGAILLDGQNIRQFSQETLRAHIAYVPQHTVLFSGTIYDNIRKGKQDATDEEVRHACAIAQASEFIEQMPDGYDSEIAQGGKNLSGGEKQRLSIARALVRKPKIYLFDDCFSALDYHTDARLRMALKEETITSTVLVVAQRVSSIMHADRILVMDQGRITGIGTHDQLLQTNDIYKEIVHSQLTEDEIA
ncbi:MAG: ABC transporter ATP-binding protein/permease [Bacteroidetes bacterium]|nr:ABC transporter ATP-binding protein/permease [Bacteroidota bacterium]